MAHHSEAPIGVFDSGIGGLSVLRHIHALLPAERLLYFADSGFAPYGDKPEQVIVDRSLAIAEFLLARGAKALVVACNTATGAAIEGLRAHHPELPLVGVEPGLKPAAALSKSRVVGVLATERTLAGAKFNALRELVGAASGVRFLAQPCRGLADLVERFELDTAPTEALLQGYIAPLLAQGADTLVLGCTHYPFVQGLVEKVARANSGTPVAVVDTGEAVARQLARLLAGAGLLRQPAAVPGDGDGDGGGGGGGGLGSSRPDIAGYTTDSREALERAIAGLLGLRPAVEQVVLEAASHLGHRAE